MDETAETAACADHAAYRAEVARIATNQIGVREVTRNRGPEVDAYLWSVGLKPSGRAPWCMAFVYWVHMQAARNLQGTTTCPKTAGVIRCWRMARKAQLLTYLPRHITSGVVEVWPGDQFIRVRRGALDDVAAARAGQLRKGHTGIVVGVESGDIVTVEGNTDDGVGPYGDGVYQKTLDPDMPELVGFVRHSLGV